MERNQQNTMNCSPVILWFQHQPQLVSDLAVFVDQTAPPWPPWSSTFPLGSVSLAFSWHPLAHWLWGWGRGLSHSSMSCQSGWPARGGSDKRWLGHRTTMVVTLHPAEPRHTLSVLSMLLGHRKGGLDKRWGLEQEPRTQRALTDKEQGYLCVLNYCLLHKQGFGAGQAECFPQKMPKTCGIRKKKTGANGATSFSAAFSLRHCFFLLRSRPPLGIKGQSCPVLP